MANQITNNLTIIDDAEGATELWSDEAHGTMTVDLETDIFVEGTGSIGDRVAGAGGEGGVGWDFGTGTDLSNTVVYMWSLFADITALDIKALGGVGMRFTGAADTDYFEVYLEGSDTLSPPSGGSGFKMYVVDVGEASLNPDVVGGTQPRIDSIHWVGMIYRTTKSIPGSSNTVYCDTFSTLALGTPGIIVEGQNGGTTPWTWQDIVDASDLTDATKAWGTISVKDGVIFPNTPIQFGDPTGTDDDYFEDATGSLVVWENNLVLDNFYGFSGVGDAAETCSFIQGIKVGSGATAVGVNGGAISTGGPRWFLDFQDPDFDVFGLYGASLRGLGDAAVNNSQLEMLNCGLVDCQALTISGAASLALSPVIRNCFFSASPGPKAQVIWVGSTPPFADAFDFNSFANMTWFGLEVVTAISPFPLRDNFFTDNGALRDILASHPSGALDFISTSISLPEVTNGSLLTFAMNGTSEAYAFTIATWEDVSVTDGTDVGSGAHPLITQSTASLSVDQDTFAISAALPAGTLTYTGASDTYTDDMVGTASGVVNAKGFVTRLGRDEITPGAGVRTGFPVNSRTSTDSAQTIIVIDEDTASTPVTMIDPWFRPLQVVKNSSGITFGYGAGSAAGNANRKTFLVVTSGHTSPAQATVVSASFATGGVPLSLTARSGSPWADDNNPLDACVVNVWDLHDSVDDMDQGTVTIVNAVTIEVTGVTEGTTVTMVATGGGDIPDGDSVGVFPLVANASGVAADPAFQFTNPQDVIIRARYAGAPLGVIYEEAAPDVDTDYTARANSTGAKMIPGTSVVISTTLDDLTRTVGSWIDDGFVEGMEISISGSASNNGNFTISTGGVTDLILTLDENLTTEGAQTDLVIHGDWVMLMTVAPIGDAIGIGGYEKFTRIRYDVIQGLGFDPGGPFWEYWNGSGWVTPGLTVDESAVDWETPGIYYAYITAIPEDWTKDQPTNYAAAGLPSAYYIHRGTITGGGTPPAALAGKITLDTTRYLPFKTTGTITSDGLTVTAVWQEDTIID